MDPSKPRAFQVTDLDYNTTTNNITDAKQWREVERPFQVVNWCRDLPGRRP